MRKSAIYKEVLVLLPVFPGSLEDKLYSISAGGGIKRLIIFK